ncbi:NADPH-dependent 1-acyl dihydroxyacetone phosphate reductase, partial [Coemansia erecta]
DERPVVLITGCSAGGIGHSLALEFARQQCQVYATARDTSKLDTGLSMLGIHGQQLDVTDTQSITDAVSRILSETGRIDVLVNNAGRGHVGPAIEADIGGVQQLVDVNVTGVLRVCQAVAPQMMDKRRGTIVNVGSVGAYAASPWIGVYAATKAALHALSDSLRLEMQPFGVSVMVVAPGSVTSNLIEKQNDTLLVAPSSRYAKALPAIREKAEFGKHIRQMPADAFAQTVVRKILHTPNKAYITYGKFAFFAWLLYYLPPAIKDAIFARRFGTRQLKQDLN